MHTRRPHKKSRGACGNCRARKLKCSEDRPSCVTCIRRGEACEYPTTVQRLAASRSDGSGSPFVQPQTPEFQQLSASSPGDVESAERRILELRLMHHFTIYTIEADFLSIHDPGVKNMWSKTAPALAFDHPFLLKIIVSIAALHIYKTNPHRRDMADVHRHYFGAALAGHRHAVQNMDVTNAEAVCVSTILLTLPAFILRQATETGEYSPPSQEFHLLASNVSLFKHAFTIIPASSPIMAVVNAKPDMELFMQEIRDEAYRKPFSRLTNWIAPGEVIDAESQEAYELALGFVGGILKYVENKENLYETRRVIYGFTTLAPPSLLRLIQEGDHRALVILAHYYALVKAVDDTWWMRGIAEREVLGIQSSLPEEWQWAMAWPLQKLAEYAAASITSKTRVS